MLGLASLLLGFTVIIPLAGIVFGIVGIGREPTRKALSVTGLVAAIVFGAAWAVLAPPLLAMLLG